MDEGRRIEARIDGASVSLESVCLQLFGFGQPHPRARSCPYQLELAPAAVVALLGEHYAEAASDDREEGGADMSNPATVAVRRLGWPPLEVLIAAHQDAALAWLRDWAHGLVDLIFQGEQRPARYAVNSIDEVALDNGTVTIRGNALDTRRPDQEDVNQRLARIGQLHLDGDREALERELETRVEAGRERREQWHREQDAQDVEAFENAEPEDDGED